MKNIVLMGKMGSGKTTAAEYLINKYGCTCLKFADPVYAIARNDYGMTTKDVGLLQLIGMSGRELRPNIWVEMLLDRLSDYKGPVVIDDCRFPNEIEALLKLDFLPIMVVAPTLIRLERLMKNNIFPTEEELKAASETSLDKDVLKYKLILNFGSITELFESIDRIIDDSKV